MLVSRVRRYVGAVFAVALLGAFFSAGNAQAVNFCQKNMAAGEVCNQGHFHTITFLNAYGSSTVCARVQASADPNSSTIFGGPCQSPNVFFTFATSCPGTTKDGYAGTRNPVGAQNMYGEFGYCS
jgi:hypothetical protein